MADLVLRSTRRDRAGNLLWLVFHAYQDQFIWEPVPRVVRDPRNDNLLSRRERELLITKSRAA